MPYLRELLTKLGFDADTSGAEKYTASLNAAKAAAKALAAAGAAAGAALFGLASETAAAGDQAAKQARMFGLTIESYQELAHAAEQSGSNIMEVTDVIKDLSKNAYDAAFMGNLQFADMFRELGVTLTDSQGNLRDQEELLLDVADGMRAVADDTKRLAIAEKLLGGSAKKLQNFFMAGSEGIQAMRQEARDLGIVLSEDVAKRSEVFSDSIDEVKKAFRGIRFIIGSSVMPAIIEYAQGLRDWFTANREIIAQNIQGVLVGLADAARMAFKPIVILVGWLKKLLDAIGGVATAATALKVVLIGLVGTNLLLGMKALLGLTIGTGKAFSWLKVQAALAQAAIFALIAAVGLIIEDLYRFFTGADSLAGRLMDWLDTSDAAIAQWYRSNIRPIFEWIADKLHAFIEMLDAIGDRAAVIREVGQALGLVSTEAQRKEQQRASAAGTLSTEEQQQILERARRIGQARGLGADAMRRLAFQMAERQAARNQANASVSVGSVSVEIQGSTAMDGEQTRQVVRQGVEDALAKPLRDLQTATEGGLE